MNQPLMSSVLDVINKRHSVRAYTSHKPDKTAIERLLAAAVRAPTALHQEPWAFVVIQDMQLLREVSDRAKVALAGESRGLPERHTHLLDIFQNPDFNIFYNATTLIAICARDVGEFVEADCWLAAENLMLAACAMGLGSCVIGSATLGLNSPEIKAELGIPREISAVAPIIVGVPNGEPAVTSRKAPWVVAWKH